MDLPILSQPRTASVDDLIRLYCKTERDWTAHTSEAMDLEIGTAFHSSSLPKVWDANSLLDAQIPVEMSARDVVAQARDHFSRTGARCRRWVMNPSAKLGATQPLVEELLGTGHLRQSSNLMRLESLTIPSPAVANEAIKLIPSRASYRHARVLAELAANEMWNEPTLADAKMLHVDDPHFDSWLAIENGVAVATAGVLSVGEIGRIDNVYVAPVHRRRGIGRLILSRVLDVCARSLFKHVLLTVATDNESAKRLYESIGFRKFGVIDQFVDTRSA